MLAALTGLLVGAWHVVSGPDHLAAIAPLASEEASGDERPDWQGARAATAVGLAWGSGHALGVWLVGGILLAFSSALPEHALESLSVWSERLVGVAIVGVGLWGLWRLRSGRDAGHHGHDHGAPAHGRRSAGIIGLVHGLAGSAHVYGVLPALALGSTASVAYLIAFGLGSIVAMAAFAGLLAGLLRHLPGTRETVQRWALGLSSVAAVIIGAAWVALS